MKESVIYPGEYIMLPATEELLHDDLTSAHASRVMKPRINMAEREDLFEIDVSVPGTQREDLFVYAHDNMLSLAILGKKVVTNKNEKPRVHESETFCIRGHIPLPENADPDFISAEYRQGILHICIPKTTKRPALTDRQIIVY